MESLFLLENYLDEKSYSMKLNLGYYPNYEPMAFWGYNTKLQEAINNEKMCDSQKLVSLYRVDDFKIILL